MKIIFYPDIIYKRIYDIKYEDLEKMGVKALVLDVDNTLTTHNNPTPDEKALDWLAEMKSKGIKMIILSNNNAKRVTPFAKMLDLPFISNGKKPLSLGLKKCRNFLNVQKDQMAVVGDQIFTDILCGKWFKIKSILVEPIEAEKNIFFKSKRWAEKRILKKYKGERRL